MEVEPAALDQLIESCGGDLRQSINTLQMWSVSKNYSKITGKGMQARLSSISKDSTLRLDAFTATPKLFDPSPMPLEDRMDLFYVDYDLIPLTVQQMYVSAADSSPAGDMNKLARISRAADSISQGDIFSDYVRSKQAWSLLPSVALANLRAVGLCGARVGFVTFPAIMGKMSTRNKRARLLAELGLHVGAYVSGGREAIRLDYADAFRMTMLAPLAAESVKDDPAPAISRVISQLDDYGMSKDDLMETLGNEVRFGERLAPGFPEYASLIESKVKAALTREYNKRPHKAQSLVAISAGTVASMKGGKRGGSRGLSSMADAAEGAEVEEEEDEILDGEAPGSNPTSDDEKDGKPTDKEMAQFKAKGRGKAAAGGAKGKAAAAGKKAAGAAGGAAAAKKAKAAPKTSGKKRKRAGSSSDSSGAEEVSDSDLE